MLLILLLALSAPSSQAQDESVPPLFISIEGRRVHRLSLSAYLATGSTDVCGEGGIGGFHIDHEIAWTRDPDVSIATDIITTGGLIDETQGTIEMEKTGIYEVSASVRVQEDASAEVVILRTSVNGTATRLTAFGTSLPQKLATRGPSGWSTHSGSVLALLEEGDVLSLYLESPGDDDCIMDTDWRATQWSANLLSTVSTASEQDDSCTCGIANSDRLIGGKDASSNEFPWVGALVKNSKVFCAAVLINSNWALTSAECVRSERAKDVSIIFGEHDLTQEEDGEVEVGLNDIIIHPDFNKRTEDFDFALLELKSSVSYSDTISPVCLPADDSNDYVGVKATVAAWGTSDSTSSAVTDILQKIEKLKVKSECEGHDAADITENMICAQKSTKTICKKDYGAPLMAQVDSDDFYTLIGTASFIGVCGKNDESSVFARVSKVVDWIKENAGDQC